MWPNLKKIADLDLVTFTEENLNEKLLLLFFLQWILRILYIMETGEHLQTFMLNNTRFGKTNQRQPFWGVLEKRCSFHTTAKLYFSFLMVFTDFYLSIRL